MEKMIIGATVMACFTITAFLINSWQRTRDRFFLFFAVSFFVDGAGRILMGVFDYPEETKPLIYLMRLAAFLLIIIAILDKNYINRIKGHDCSGKG